MAEAADFSFDLFDNSDDDKENTPVFDEFKESEPVMSEDYDKWKPSGCKSVDIITYDKLILEILCSKLITIQWFMANGIISNERICQKCGSKMLFSKYPAHSCGYRWECRKYTKENKHYQTGDKFVEFLKIVSYIYDPDNRVAP